MCSVPSATENFVQRKGSKRTMGRISLELVPRDVASFSGELSVVKKRFPLIDTLNIPDILKFDMRIPEACRVASGYFSDIIPHIRAVSISKSEASCLVDIFDGLGIKEVLVILGDNPEIISRSSDPCDSIALIRKIKKETKAVKVYAGLDQWRTSFDEELEYVKRKIDSGADGFFTQPFFDVHHLEQWHNVLGKIDVFWGVAPVVRESSRHYWEKKNNVSFPESFQCTMAWNHDFAREVLELSSGKNFHVYFCPITVDFVEYLQGIF